MGERKYGRPMFVLSLPKEEDITFNQKLKIRTPVVLTSNMMPIEEYYTKKDLVNHITNTFLFPEEDPQKKKF